ncbi:MAG: RhuM family protein [Rudaea sp.]|uniref:RhuM family protein n=1 Tax=Rudaea sp. TaxID=2136325 RepID=UPI0039E46606
MSLMAALASARTEEDVKDAYIKALGLKKYNKGLIDIRTDEIWFEAKETSTPAILMFAQLLCYVRDARKKGEHVPPFLAVIDREKAALMETAKALPILADKSIKWPKSGSAVDKAMAAQMAPYIETHFVVYKLDSHEKEFIAAVSFKGAFYTPLHIVDKAYDLLANTLGKNWQQNYIVWDMCCGVGNLEVKHSNHRNIYMSTLDQADIDVMRASHTCVAATKFQYDYLNDDIDDFGQIDYSLTNKMTALFSSVHSIGHAGGYFITPENLWKVGVMFGVRRLVKPTWLNDRDQFLQPARELSDEFKSDCLIWMLFNGSNLSAGANGLEWNDRTWSLVNHFIPYTEQEVGACGRFESDFMSNTIADLDLSREATAVLNEGRRLWNLPQTCHLRVREVFTLAADYRPSLAETTRFFQIMQNKLHYAVTGLTAPEIIASRINHRLPNAGLTAWTGATVRKGDVTIAKNYLQEDEIRELNRIVTMWLDFAEDQAERRKQVFMVDWKTKLDEFLRFNDRKVLPGAGKRTRKEVQCDGSGRQPQRGLQAGARG